jgi:uncharacterized membrane protein YjdF
MAKCSQGTSMNRSKRIPAITIIIIIIIIIINHYYTTLATFEAKNYNSAKEEVAGWQGSTRNKYNETITTRLVKIVTTIITISGIVVMLHSNNHVYQILMIES